MEPDNKELALNEASSSTVTVPAKSEVAEMFQGLMELARDPAVDADKMASLADLQLTMLKHKQQEEYNRDKIAALMEMPMMAILLLDQDVLVLLNNYIQFFDRI